MLCTNLDPLIFLSAFTLMLGEYKTILMNFTQIKLSKGVKKRWGSESALYHSKTIIHLKINSFSFGLPVTPSSHNLIICLNLWQNPEFIINMIKYAMGLGSFLLFSSLPCEYWINTSSLVPQGIVVYTYNFDHLVSVYIFFGVLLEIYSAVMEPTCHGNYDCLLSVRHILLHVRILSTFSEPVALMALSAIFCDRYTLPISRIFRQRVHWFYPADTREVFLKLLKSKVSWLISVISK